MGEKQTSLLTWVLAEDWENLAEALRSLASNWPVIQSMESSHGTKYIVEGEIVGPIGKNSMVRTFGLSIADRRLHDW